MLLLINITCYYEFSDFIEYPLTRNGIANSIKFKLGSRDLPKPSKITVLKTWKVQK